VEEGRSHRERRVRAGLSRHEPGLRRAHRRQAGSEASSVLRLFGRDGLMRIGHIFIESWFQVLIGSSNATREKAQVSFFAVVPCLSLLA
jgi:hypothetical protein